MRFVHPWVASDPKKMHRFRSHQIGQALTPQLDTQGRYASYCNDISQRPPFRTLTFSKMFCNTSCSSSDLSCGQVDKRCVKIPWYQISQQAMTTTSSSTSSPPAKATNLATLVDPGFPPVDGLESEKVFSGKYLQNKIHEKKASQKKWKIWSLKGGEWWIKNPFRVKLENFEREEPTAFWTHPRVDLWLGIRTPASATSFKAFTSILPKDS